MMRLYWFFAALGVVIAIYSDDIQRILGADPRLKNVIFVVCGGIILILAVPVIFRIFT